MPYDDDPRTPEDLAREQRAQYLWDLFKRIPEFGGASAYTLLQRWFPNLMRKLPIPSDPFTAGMKGAGAAAKKVSPVSLLLSLGGSQSDLAKPSQPRSAQPLRTDIPQPGNFATAGQWEDYLKQAKMFAKGSTRKPKRKPRP